MTLNNRWQGTPKTIEKLEEFRRRLRNIHQQRVTKSFVLYPSLILFSMWVYSLYFHVSLIFAFLAVIALQITLIRTWAWLPIQDYQHAFRNFVAKNIEETLGVNNLKFERGKIPPELILDSNPFPVPDYRAKYYISMRYEGAKLLISDTRNNYFKGTFVYIELPNNKFLSRTFITENKILVDELTQENKFNVKKVKLVDSKVEGLIDVFSEDQVEARYLVHPSFIEKYKILAKNHYPLNISFFKNRRVFLSIPNLINYFNPDINDSVLHELDVEESKKQIRYLLDMIDVLLLTDLNKT